MDQATFQKTVEARSSRQYHVNKVTKEIVFLVMRNMQEVGGRVDEVKRSLFYGKDNGGLLVDTEINTRFNHEYIHGEVMHGLMGVIGEAGELAERVIAMGAFPERAEEHKLNLIEELGDLEWYMALIYSTLGLIREDVLAANDRKLEARFGPAFKAEAALGERDKDAENKALKGE